VSVGLDTSKFVWVNARLQSELFRGELLAPPQHEHQCPQSTVELLHLDRFLSALLQGTLRSRSATSGEVGEVMTGLGHEFTKFSLWRLEKHLS
jgi:hypothetical protein